MSRCEYYPRDSAGIVHKLYYSPGGYLHYTPNAPPTKERVFFVFLCDYTEARPGRLTKKEPTCLMCLSLNSL